MIPISLVITLEVVKFFQSIMIELDNDMYYEPLNQRVKVQNTLIHEELGRIEYVFADKTGTLTSNIMKFKRCAISQVEFCFEELKEICSNIKSYEYFMNPSFEMKNKMDFYDFWLSIALNHGVILDDKNNFHVGFIKILISFFNLYNLIF